MPSPLLEARDAADAEDICERLRAAGIKCNWLEEDDPTRPAFGWSTRKRFEVYVDELDIDRAAQALASAERGAADP